MPIVYHDAVTYQTDLIVAGNFTLNNHAAGGNANLRYLKGISDICNACLYLLLGWFKHTDTCRIDILNGLIYDAVSTNLNAIALGGKTRFCIRANTEADDDGI